MLCARPAPRFVVPVLAVVSVFAGFYTIDHNRTALLPGATERFKRACLMVSRDEAIK